MLNNPAPRFTVVIGRGLLGVGLLAVAGFLATSGQSEADTPPVPPPPRPVSVAEVRRGEVAPTRTLWGTARARDRATLSFVVRGRVERVAVDVGDRVTRGELLVVLDSRELRHGARQAAADVTQREAQLEQLQRDRARADALLEQRVVSAEQAERASTGTRSAAAGVDAALAQLAETRRLVSESTLRAPFDGVITRVQAREGEVASPGAPMLELVGDSGALEIEADVPDVYAAELDEERGVEVRARDGVARTARLAGLARASGAPGQLLRARFVIEGSSAGLRPGQTLELRLPGAAREVVLAPLAAVLDPSGSGPRVYRVDDGHAERRPVQLGAVHGTDIEIREGLEPGDRVVVGGRALLLDREPIEIESRSMQVEAP